MDGDEEGSEEVDCRCDGASVWLLLLLLLLLLLMESFWKR